MDEFLFTLCHLWLEFCSPLQEQSFWIIFRYNNNTDFFHGQSGGHFIIESTWLYSDLLFHFFLKALQLYSCPNGFFFKYKDILDLLYCQNGGHLFYKWWLFYKLTASRANATVSPHRYILIYSAQNHNN